MNIVEKIISKALIDSDISHDEFTLAIEEQNYFRLKNITVKDNQLGNIKRGRLREEHGKGIRQNERHSLIVKTELWDQSIKSIEIV